MNKCCKDPKNVVYSYDRLLRYTARCSICKRICKPLRPNPRPRK